MAVKTVDEFLARARSALAMPTLYMLSFGGWTNDAAAPPLPGTKIDAVAALAQMKLKDKAKYDAYMAGVQQAGLDVTQLPHVACDCSGFVTWALGVPRFPGRLAGTAANWINTNAIHADAKGPRQLFSVAAQPVVGGLLVYPGVDAQHKVGHVAIISEVSGGRPTRMIHCAPENYLVGGGTARNAILETGTEHFAHEPDTIVALWNGFARA